MIYAVRITRVIEEETWVTVEAASEEDAEENSSETTKYNGGKGNDVDSAFNELLG